MTSRDRVLTAVNHRVPDRIPIDFWAAPEVFSRLAWLKKEYGRSLAFQGGIDIQGVLPHATPAEVKKHVRSRAEVLGEGGGYLFGTAHSILPDTPTENILALVEAYQEYGRY